MQFVNTAGAVPGKASVARNIARSSSLREPGLLVIVARFSNRGPSGVTGGLRHVCNVSHGLFRRRGFDEQIFGADKQVPERGQSD